MGLRAIYNCIGEKLLFSFFKCLLFFILIENQYTCYFVFLEMMTYSGQYRKTQFIIIPREYEQISIHSLFVLLVKCLKHIFLLFLGGGMVLTSRDVWVCPRFQCTGRLSEKCRPTRTMFL